MGDGVLVYFGYPAAHEDDAERAVRAGIALIDAVPGLSAPEPLQVRIGIATGLAVVGDLIGEGEAQERGIVGETPNLAARLQGLAEPGTMAIAAATRRLLGDRFTLRPLDRHELKGFAKPVEAWAVEGVSGVESRFESVRGGGLTGFVGREHELGLLMERWHLARDGEGQVVLLSGEPGIGKSRIMSELRARLEQGGARSLVPLFAVLRRQRVLPDHRQFRAHLAVRPRRHGGTKLDKLEALVVGQYARPRGPAFHRVNALHCV